MFWGNWDKRDEWLPAVTWAGLTGPPWASGHSTVDPLAQNPLTRPPWACLFSVEQPLHCTSPSSSYVRLLLLRMKHSRVETTVQRWSGLAGRAGVLYVQGTLHMHTRLHVQAHTWVNCHKPNTPLQRASSTQKLLQIHVRVPTSVCVKFHINRAVFIRIFFYPNNWHHISVCDLNSVLSMNTCILRAFTYQ